MTVGASIKKEKTYRYTDGDGLALLKVEGNLYLVQGRSDLNFVEQSDLCMSVKQVCFILSTAVSVPLASRSHLSYKGGCQFHI